MCMVLLQVKTRCLGKAGKGTFRLKMSETTSACSECRHSWQDVAAQLRSAQLIYVTSAFIIMQSHSKKTTNGHSYDVSDVVRHDN